MELLKLESLEIRRVKKDLILLFKMYHDIIDVKFNDFFQNNYSQSTYNLRGHNAKLQVPRFSGSNIKHNFFKNRVVKIWNMLPSDLINSASLEHFKIKLNELNLNEIYTSKCRA